MHDGEVHVRTPAVQQGYTARYTPSHVQYPPWIHPRYTMPDRWITVKTREVTAGLIKSMSKTQCIYTGLTDWSELAKG